MTIHGNVGYILINYKVNENLKALNDAVHEYIVILKNTRQLFYIKI